MKPISQDKDFLFTKSIGSKDLQKIYDVLLKTFYMLGAISVFFFISLALMISLEFAMFFASVFVILLVGLWLWFILTITVIMFKRKLK